MGIEISLHDLKVSGSAEIMNGAKVRSNNDVHISLEHAEIKEYAKVLNDLEIDSVLNELSQQARTMDKNSVEYQEIRKIIGVKQWNKNEFVKCITKHISEFSKGVLASIVANAISK